MKREKNAGGLFGLLARQYLLFTLALLAIAAAVFALWMLYTARLYRAPDWDSLLADPALAEGKWEALRRPGQRLCGLRRKGRAGVFRRRGLRRGGGTGGAGLRARLGRRRADRRL